MDEIDIDDLYVDDLNALRWESDWSGDEVGFDDVCVVGCYTDDEENITYYIDTETGKILQAWHNDED